ncbi:hypothetical protein [Intrasporangium sp. DVR]|uniref:hypothetical protein n=1 Tax=Intrasporangium sp. DVR TaxID=3127867 RepID=UPI00313A5164
MTSASVTTPRKPSPERTGSDRVGVVRRRLAVATVTVCLPYTLLKALWVSGVSVGASAEGFTDTTRAANLVTGGMDLVAMILAIAFVAPWGRRLPAFLVAFPLWIGSGLLAPVAVGFLVGTPLQLATGGGNPFTGDDVLSPWVFGLVYSGFVLQAVLLVPGFLLYARTRWPVATGGGRVADGEGDTGPLQRILGSFLVVAAMAFAGVQLSGAVQSGGSSAGPSLPQRTLFTASALAAVAAAVGTTGLVRGKRLTRARLATVWLGSGVIFTTALSETLRNVSTEPGHWAAPGAGPGERTTVLLILLMSLGGAIGGALRLVEEERAHPTS